MPPSPVRRFSPSRELRVQNHKRGRSLDGGLFRKEKEDDLALFNDMQTKETDNFLLQSTDDFDDSLSMKLRCFLNSKLEISIPARGESSDLLDGDADKNDYDWLLTPPETPLFPSLEDETLSVNLARTGRPRSQPVSFARSATMDKSSGTSRSSASPRRLSPSPRPGNSLQSRGRPSSSASRGSPALTLRPTTPSQSPSDPPHRPSTPTPRSSTPTLRRMNSGLSSSAVSSGKGGTSPIKTSRGNSPSPKSRAWQADMPGFSLEAPPNLRTSVADRPASYVRGSSPASRNGRGSSPASRNGRVSSPASTNGRGSSPASRDGRGSSPASRDGRGSSSKSERQSMSPTASRSASSSYSHDRDRFSSQSKGSVASSGDDDVDSPQSIRVNVSARSSVRKVGVFPNSRGSTFSQRLSSTSSAPKRSFDSALRQMDRRGPQMFRPLLSSVPSTTFYLGKTSSSHHSTISQNSSFATSSNASSDLGTSVALNTEGSDHCQDVTSNRNIPKSDARDEVSILDKADGLNKDSEHEIHDGPPILAHYEIVSSTSEARPGEFGNLSSLDSAADIPASASGSSNIEDFNCLDNVVSCSKCSKEYCSMGLAKENDKICPDCRRKDVRLPHSQSNLADERLGLEVGVPELRETIDGSHTSLFDDEIYVDHGQICSADISLTRSIMEEGKKHIANQQLVGQDLVCSDHLESASSDQQLQTENGDGDLKIDVVESDEVFVYRKTLSSKNLYVAEGRDFSANIPDGNLSCARDSTNTRSSIFPSSVSTSSSLDLSSSKQEPRVQRQLSGKKASMESSGHDFVSKHRRRGSSFSEISDHSSHTMCPPKSTTEDTLDASYGNIEYKLDDPDSSFIKKSALEREKSISTEICRTMNSSTSELSSHSQNIHLEDTSTVTTFQDDDYCTSSENAEDMACQTRNTSVIGERTVTLESSTEEDVTLNSFVYKFDAIEDPTYSLLSSVSEELENCHESISGSQTEHIESPSSDCSINESNNLFVLPTPEEGIPTSANELSVSDSIREKSSLTGDVYRRQEESSVSKEEEADETLLFCSSIVRDLAFGAATIAMEKENVIPLETPRPMVTILGKTSSDRKDSRNLRTVNKRPSKSQKARQKRAEVDGKVLSTKTDTNIKQPESLKHDSGIPNKVDSLKPPKLESKCNCTIM